MILNFILNQIKALRNNIMAAPANNIFSPQRASEKKMKGHRVDTVFLCGSPLTPWFSVA